jgi:hypothetical protein
MVNANCICYRGNYTDDSFLLHKILYFRIDIILYFFKIFHESEINGAQFSLMS